MIVQICVGSSCHLKGSEKLVEMFQSKIADCKLDGDITLAGSFCTGKCNRVGVTITVGDDIHTGITPDGFDKFWDETIIPALRKSEE